jgi:hypothetical protein
MATLIKISNVQLLAGFTTETAVRECFLCEQLLNDNAIPHELANYQVEHLHTGVFENLSTWTYKDSMQYQITDFPIMLWRETYDTGEQSDCIVLNSTDLANCNIILRKDLI